MQSTTLNRPELVEMVITQALRGQPQQKLRLTVSLTRRISGAEDEGKAVVQVAGQNT